MGDLTLGAIAAGVMGMWILSMEFRLRCKASKELLDYIKHQLDKIEAKL